MRILKSFLIQLRDPKLKKTDKVKIHEEIEKCRIRTQAYLRRMHCRHNIIEDFGEVILNAYDRFLVLKKRCKSSCRAQRKINSPQRN